MADTARILEDFARAQAATQPFLERALEATRGAPSIAFRAAYASVTRRLGAAAASLPVATPPVSDSARPHWSLSDWIRAALLARALGFVEEKAQAALVLELFEGGELGEQESLLRTLGLLPEPARFLETALLGCRTNARRVFEAIACENAYPAAHFPELGFNQMVLKAIFVEVPVARIEGLATRRGPELVRMVRAYASERRAAGRAVPNDVELVLAGSAP